MKRMVLLLLVSASASLCSAEKPEETYDWKIDGGGPAYGSVLMKNETNTFGAGADLTESVKSGTVFINSESQTHKFAFGIGYTKDGQKRAGIYRGKYTLSLPLLQRKHGSLGSETSFAVGMVDAGYLQQSSEDLFRFEFMHFLFGIGEFLTLKGETEKITAGLKVGGEYVGSRLDNISEGGFDYSDSITQWDNYGGRSRGYLYLKANDRLTIRTEGDAAWRHYNPERYFFVEKWVTDRGIRMEGVFSVNPGLDLVPFVSYRRIAIERKIGGRPDLERPEYGAKVVFKDVVRRGVNAYAKGSYAPWLHKSGKENLVALGVDSKSVGLEIFRRGITDNYSSFSLKENIVGFRFNWKFGSPNGRKVSEIEEYGRVAKREHKFYLDSGAKDNTSLTRVQQAERLRTLKNRVEWSRKNLRYGSYPSEGYQQELVYQMRVGDCDGQACQNSTMDTLNGYRSKTTAWFDFSKSNIGHAVGLTQDPTNGQWFLDEYGMAHKVDVAPGADMQTVMKEALRQTHFHTALPISSGKDTTIYPIECSQPGSAQWGSSFVLGDFPRLHERPKIEYGPDLFAGPDFLFDYGQGLDKEF